MAGHDEPESAVTIRRNQRSRWTGIRMGNEIQLTDGIAGLLRSEKVYAYRYEGKRYDCGSKEGFLEANVELALQHPQVGAWFKQYLKALPLD
jgi:UTP--glucose-1-phosphate uridylyltransferase